MTCGIPLVTRKDGRSDQEPDSSEAYAFGNSTTCRAWIGDLWGGPWNIMESPEITRL